jgi:hypothetical protein
MDDNGLLVRADAAIDRGARAIGLESPGNTIRGPIRAIANVAKPLLDYFPPVAITNSIASAMGVNPSGDERSIGQQAADTGAGIAGLAWRAGTPNGEGPGDFLRTIGAPEAAQSVDQAEQNFQQRNRAGLESLGQLGFAAGGVAPDMTVPGALRVPSKNSLVGGVSPTLGEAASTLRNPELQGLRDIAGAVKKDPQVNLADTYQRMTPTPEPGSSIPQSTVNRIIDLHSQGWDTPGIVTTLGISPNVAQTYIDKFHTDIEPKYAGSNLFETLRTPKDKEFVATPNMTDLVYQAANSPGEGQARTMQVLRQRQADAVAISSMRIASRLPSMYLNWILAEALIASTLRFQAGMLSPKV